MNDVEQILFICNPTDTFRIGDYLKSSLMDRRWNIFRAAVAFVKTSGTKHIRDELRYFSKFGNIKLSIGIDLEGTSAEGLADLMDCTDNNCEIWIFHNLNNSTFHPKIYLFKNENAAEVLIGSANLTEGGLYTNYEIGIKLCLNFENQRDRKLYKIIESAMDYWSTPHEGLCSRLDSRLFKHLKDSKVIPSEVSQKLFWDNVKIQTKENFLFKKTAVPKAPVIPVIRKSKDQKKNDINHLFPDKAASRVFLMTLQRTDVGIGQVTMGTSKRSPEIFIPLAARDADKNFWGWPDLFTPDPLKPGKKDRFGVKMRMGAKVVNVNIMTWPDKHDFRLRSEELRRAGNIGDILYLEKGSKDLEVDYYVEIIPLGSVRYDGYLMFCSNAVRNSRRLWGYL
ncbi:MAG: phospholipase D family protein [Treponema sp.]|jgi:HKD family nuclease|nr:phospholipase D family protein [Treponema sp.]